MFQQALALHRQGRFLDAARGYQSVLEAEPEHVDALVHLGALRLGQGRPADAEALLRRAAAVAPDSAEVHGNLAAALQAAGRHADAVGHYEQALGLRPDMADARFGLAACLQALGRQEAAVACYEAILDSEPAHPEANFGLATLMAGLNRVDEAIACYRAALAADADFAEASHGLGMLLRRTGCLDEAAGSFRNAIDVDPDYIEARVALGQVLQRQERDDEAMAAYRAALDLDAENGPAHYGLATILCLKHRDTEAIPHFEAVLAREPEHLHAMTGLAGALRAGGRHTEAIALCRAAAALQPGFARAMNGLGLALAEAGDIEGGVAACRRAVELAPHRPEACFNLTQLVRIRPGEPVIEALEVMLPHAASFPPRERCLLHFALAKAYDDIGERDRGFAQLLEGNAIKRRGIEYRVSDHLDTMDRIRAVFTDELMTARGGMGDMSAVPVFVVGMPRSGTTLVEQVLASHGGVFGAGERGELTHAVDSLSARVGALRFPEAAWTIDGEELRAMGADYVAALRPLAPDALRIVDKMPLNFLFAGLIPLILPKARIIHVIRDPVDTCLSCFSKLFGGELPFAYDLGELGRFYRGYQGLMAHWRSVLPPSVLLEVHYERLVDDFEAEARRMVAHCGLDWDDACLTFHKTSRAVRTASVTQVREPIFRHSIGRWRPDAGVLRPLLEALGPDRREAVV